MVFSPDGQSLAASWFTGSGDRTGLVIVWDMNDGRKLHTWTDRKELASSLAFSPDGRTLAVGGESGGLQLRELASGQKRHTYVGHEGHIYALAFSPEGRSLAASSADAPVYLWDVAIEQKQRVLPPDELQRDWRLLAGEDAAAAFQAIRRLSAAPEQTVSFLRDHLKPVTKPDLKRVRQLVEALDSPDFAARQKAREELEKQADAGGSLLRQIMDKEKPALEVRRSLQQILEAQAMAPESWRVTRAVEVLEWIATTEANHLLVELANGAPDARLTREAAAAVKRLKRKKE
jgi:hypothetical protein